MNHIEFFKRFPTENDAIDFIVSTLQEYVDVFCYRLNHRDIDEALVHLLGLGIAA